MVILVDSGQLPCLVVQDKVLAGAEIIQYVFTTVDGLIQGLNIDAQLDEQVQSKCHAYSALVEQYLCFALVLETHLAL